MSRKSRRHHAPQSAQAPTSPRQPTPIRGSLGSLALAEAKTKHTPLNALTADDIPAGQMGLNSWGPAQQSTGKPIPHLVQPSDTKPDLNVIGASGTAIFSGIITTDEYNPDLLNWVDRVAIYDQMRRNDGQVKALLKMLALPLLRAQWTIEKGTDDAAGEEIQSFVESCLFHDMQYESTEGLTVYQTWDEILRHILLMYTFGAMAFETCYRVDDGWVKWSKWTPLLPRTIWRWWAGADNELAGIQQWTFKNWNYEFVNIPAGKLLTFTMDKEGSNFEGISILRAAYKHWYYKQSFEKIDAIALERGAIVPPVIKLPPGFTTADMAAAQQIVQNIRANEQMGVTIPMEWEFDFPRNQQKYAAQTLPTIQYHDVMIARAALAQHLNVGSSEVGAYNLADAQIKVFEQAVQADAKLIEEVINQTAIRRLVDYNFENVEVYPRLKCGKVSLTDISMIAQALQQMVGAQLIHPTPELEDALLDAFGLPKGTPSPVTATNPTSPTTPDQPTAAQPQANNEGQLKPSDAGSQNAAAGAALAESRLLREALDVAASLDVVERGLQFSGHLPGYSQNRGAGGRWGVGDGGEGEHGGGGGVHSPHGISAEHGTHEQGGKGSAGGGGKAGAAGERTARISVRAHNFHGQAGYLISGRDSSSRQISIFSKSRPEAERMRDDIKAGREPHFDSERAATKATGTASKAAKPAAEGMHERSARLQREGGLKAEVRPGAGLRAVKAVPGYDTNPALAPNARFLAQHYGEHQLGAALSRETAAKLRTTAEHEGLSTSGGKAALVSRITAHVTEGRYSANFGAGGKAGAAKGEGATASKGSRSRSGSTAAKAAKGEGGKASGGKSAREQELERQLASVKAERDALKAGKAAAEPKAAKGTTGGTRASKASGGAKTRHEVMASLHVIRQNNDAIQARMKSHSGLNGHEHVIHEVRITRDLYGLHQLKAALSIHTFAGIREMAHAVQEAHPGTKPKNFTNKNDMIDYIHARMTAEGEMSNE
jgi:hypothetical protein